MKFAKTLLLLTLIAAAWAQVNVGEQKPETSRPFNMTTVATFKLPWRLAFLPDGRMLVTEKVGPVWLVSQRGCAGLNRHVVEDERALQERRKRTPS